MTDRVTIRSDRLSAEINPLGAELYALRDAGGRDLQWDGDPAVWSGRAPILFPVIGIVNGGVIHVDGQAYPMAKHGFARRRRFAIAAQDDAAVTFRLEDDAETRKSYPFAFRLDIRFAIAGATLSVVAMLANPGEVPLPASFGFHPALRWPLPYGAARAEHRIRFDEAEPAPIRRIDGEGLLRPVPEPTPVDGRDLHLCDDLFVDDALIFDAHRSRGVTYGASGTDTVRVEFPDMPELGVWTKPGAEYICIEPWAGIADPEGYVGEFRDKPGVIEVAPGAQRDFTLRIMLGARALDRHMAVAHINRIGTATPPHDVHDLFVAWARDRVDDRRDRALFERMAGRSGIAHRWSVLEPTTGGTQLDRGGFYADMRATTAKRMRVYAAEAPTLALQAIAALGPLGEITHLVVASCTGFVAPGIDQIIARTLGLRRDVERTLVGFMGCYAAIAALRVAHHIVRSEPAARVLVVTVELCTLHLQDTAAIEPLLAMLQFGDGAAAAIVSAEPSGLAITRMFAEAIADAHEMITWTIGDNGFVMELSGAVPARIAAALADQAVRALILPEGAADAWAVHAGGRSVLDAVARAFDLPDDALTHSRTVLAEKGNMSSATLMFVLARILAEERGIASGVAVAFGPGLAAEGFGFRSAG